MALSSYTNNWVLPLPPPIPPSLQIASFESFKTEFNFNDCDFDSAEHELLLLEQEQQQQQQTELLLLLEAEQQQQQQLNFYDNNYCGGGGGGGECEFEDNLSNSFIDPYFNPNEFFYSDEYNFNLNFNYDNSPSMISLSPQHIHPYPLQKCQKFHDPSMISLSPHHLDPHPLQKRQKVDDQFPNNAVDFCNNGHAPLNGGTRNIWLPKQIQAPDQAFKYEGNLWFPDQNHLATPNGVKYGNVERNNVSPQSVAARERRRKITDKTSELGKLIPGGSKMNTAEMFQSAYKYVKYLQASISLLQTMHKIQENKIETSNMGALQVLLQSTTVQEKLTAKEKCLVPIDFVKVLADRHEPAVGSSIGHDLNQLVGSENI